MVRKKIVFVFCCLLWAGGMKAQDCFLTLDVADSVFVQKNMEVLAARCNIDCAKGELIQSKLYSNPVVSLDENVYNRLNKKYFDFGKQSEQVVTVDQLISIAGQHRNAVRVAKASEAAAEDEFANLLRCLHSELNQTFVRLFFAQQNLTLFEEEIFSLRNVLEGLKREELKDNISKMETARIEALLLSLRQEQDQYLSEESKLESQLRIFLALPADTKVRAVFDVDCLDKLYEAAPDSARLADFLQERADVRWANDEVGVAYAQWRMQKSHAFPEVHIVGQYDRNAGYFPNYFSIGVSLSLPVFNHNQGNIRSAKSHLMQCRYLSDDALRKAQDELSLAYQNLRRCLKLSSAVAKDFDEADMKNLFEGVNENYKKRNISLLEFVDFYKTYKDAILQVSDVKQSAFLAIEDLNKAVGQVVIRY